MTHKAHKHHEHNYRSAAKAVTYRVVITTQLLTTTYILTGSTGTAWRLTGWSVVLGTVIYYIHERVWAHIAWGRTKSSYSKGNK